jgi:hypothetical protein
VSDRIIVKADGLNQIVRDIQKLGVEVSDIKEAFRVIGREGVRVEKKYAPEKTGALKSTIRHTNAKNYAAVLTGYARKAPYSRIVNYGSRRTGLRGQFYGQKMSRELGPRAVRILQSELNKLIRKA